MKKLKIPESSWLLYLYLPILIVQMLLMAMVEPTIRENGKAK